MELFTFQVFLFFVILITSNYNARRTKPKKDEDGIQNRNRPNQFEDDDQYGSCTINIWDTGEMKADDLPSIFPIIQQGPDESPTFHLPVFKSSDRKLQIEFKHKEKLIFICNQNTVNVDAQIIKCSNGHMIPDTETIEECEISKPKPELFFMNLPCGGYADTELYLIGYIVYPMYSSERFMNGDTSMMTKAYFPFIQVCLDPVRKITLYTSHTIDGNVIAARQILSSIPEEFSMEGYVVFGDKFTTQIDKPRSLRKTYRPQSQFHYLYTVFKEKLRDYFDNEDNNFVPRQLTPDYDMMLKNYKTLTHYYINTAPQWKIISCTWDALEELIRERAARQHAQLTIYTGTHETLTLDGIEVFLSNEELSVPKYFWKIVLQRKKSSYSAIGFITSNNPYDTEKNTFCQSICRPKLWPIDVKTPGLGRTVCCTVKELLTKMEINIPIPKIDSDKFMDLSEVQDVLVLPG